MDITISGGNVLGANSSTGVIQSVPVTGGVASVVTSGEDSPRAIAVNGDSVYWMAGQGPVINARAARLRSTGLAGGPVVTVVEPPAGVNGFVVSPDGQTIYFSTASTVQKVSVSAPGAVPVVVAEDIGGTMPMGLALDGDYLGYAPIVNSHVQSVKLVDGVLARCDVYDGDTPIGVDCTYIGKVINEPPLIAATNGQFCWPDQGGIVFNAAAATGNSYEETVVPDPIAAIAADDGTVFFSTIDTMLPGQGLVGKVALTSGAPVHLLARDQNAPGSVAVDATRVYWSTGDCAILSTPR